MCGIAGIIATEPCDWMPSSGKAILDRLYHRGPDDHGWLTYSGGDGPRFGQGAIPERPAEVLLLHRRLSILDLSEAGRQPMSSPDGRYWIAYNGEIYNYLELRAELAAAGHTFRTGTDTEVLLAALARWGPAALPRLVGMFAFALLDTVGRKMVLARDYFGIKPLYYCRTTEALGFASEIKALFDMRGVRPRIDPQGLYDYLRFGKTDHRPQTMLAGIRQVPPAHLLEIALDQPLSAEPLRYWHLDPRHTTDLPFDEAAGRLRQLFLDSVRLHLRSDVPVGTALSGGIDSSSIVMAVRKAAEDGVDFHSFSFIAADPAMSEERWVDTAAAAARTTVHKVTLEAAELAADLDRLIAVQDEPFGSTSVYAQYRVCQLAREAGIKVLLDGQGSDEMLAGYRHYLPAHLASLLRRGRLVRAFRLFRGAQAQPDVSLRELALCAGGALLPEVLKKPVRRLVTAESFPRWMNRAWFLEHRMTAPAAPARATPTLPAALLDDFTHTSLPALLRYEDRNSMAFSIESRVPFLTPQLAEFVFSLRESYLLSDEATSKHVFRAAMRGLVPDVILDRRDKIGFLTPDKDWLSTLRPWVDQVLGGDAARSIPALCLDEFIEESRRMFAGQARFDLHIWRFLNLIRWTEQLGVQF
jgi:asparagine synthase (glutamine-hydrolysing)